MKKHSNNDLSVHLSLMLLCVIPVLLAFLLVTNGEVTTFRFDAPAQLTVFPCIFKTATGYNCPTCGMTRSFVYMSRLDIKAALEMKKAGVLLYIFCVLQFLYRLLVISGRVMAGRRITKLMTAVFLVFIGIVDLFEFVIQFK